MVGPCGAREGGLPQSLREGGENQNVSSRHGRGGVGEDQRPEWMRLSLATRNGSGTLHGRQRQEDGSTAGAHVERDGRQMWAECMQALRQAGTDTITRGVQGLRVDEGNDAAAQEPLDFDDVDIDDDCNSDDLPEIRPLGRKVRNGGASAKKGSILRNWRNKKIDDDTGGSDGEAARNFWSVGDTITREGEKGSRSVFRRHGAQFQPHRDQGMELGGQAVHVAEDGRHEESRRLQEEMR
ncbi:hypothetical protein CBR_g302 [Chara braunii]|uniref:Uncharacterized protein n=1 Tax=Chara braunii TaxID=69332 RepID=A0A388JQB5_CHABU|nr:hypothetical protein CBR_g302 [Chara braunii]|eukprot:GBG59971.1 hypothetical protein CBR_g302 [Chara braunii]